MNAQVPRQRQSVLANLRFASYVQIQELVGGLDTSTSFAAFDKMEEKVLALEAEAESTALLIGSDSMEGKFKELEGTSVNDELAQYVPSSSPKHKCLRKHRGHGCMSHGFCFGTKPSECYLRTWLWGLL